jgi:hypothetical protein
VSANSGQTTNDPVVARRARIARQVVVGKRVGYGLFGLAIVVFLVGFVVGYTEAMTTVIAFSLIVGSLVLAPAIVFGYGVRSAEREERGIPRRH